MIKIKNYLYALYQKIQTVCSLHAIIKSLFSIIILCTSYIFLREVRQIVAVTNNSTASFFAIITDEQEGSNNDSNDMSARININEASKEVLMTLPNIGDKKAEEIIQYRTTTPFEDPQDLQEVKGIGAKTFAQLAQLITV